MSRVLHACENANEGLKIRNSVGQSEGIHRPGKGIGARGEVLQGAWFRRSPCQIEPAGNGATHYTPGCKIGLQELTYTGSASFATRAPLVDGWVLGVKLG